jgi:ABC-type sugar transport system ATPase subunit
MRIQTAAAIPATSPRGVNKTTASKIPTHASQIGITLVSNELRLVANRSVASPALIGQKKFSQNANSP